MITIGIDVSKEKLDVCMGKKCFTIANTQEALKKLFKDVEQQDTSIVMEATGRYHRLSHEVLTELGFQVMVINPYQSRHFAKAMNVLCKTDKVDAKVLALYGERMDFKPQNFSKVHQEMQDFVRYLEDLKQTKKQLRNRVHHATGFIL